MIDNWHWTTEEDNKLRALYARKATKQEVLATLSKRGYRATKYRAQVLGIKKTRLQTKNESFFETPNHLNCSIAGFLASDGNVQKPHKKNGYRVTIGLARKDEDVLSAIILATQSNANISRTTMSKTITTDRVKIPQLKTYYASYLTFSNAKKWIEDLEKNWNITENKSLTLPPPNLTDMELSLAYLIGIINGDGTIGLQKTPNRSYPYIRLLGTQALLNWAKNLFEKTIKEPIAGLVSPERSTSRVYEFQVNGLQAVKLFLKLNKIDCLRLARKWQNPTVLACLDVYKAKYPHLFDKSLTPPTIKHEESC